MGNLLTGNKHLKALEKLLALGALVLLLGLVLYFYRDLKASRTLAQKIKTPP